MERYSAEHVDRMGLPFFERVEERGDLWILRLRGAVDRHTLPAILRFREDLIATIGPFDRHLLIDLRRVTHVDSAAVAALLMSMSNLQTTHRRLGLVHAPQELLDILDVFKYTSLFHLYDDETEAVRSLCR
jgi:anti-anti-sigma factor